jgi:hypothetical protein
METLRNAKFAGRFYPNNKAEIEHLIEHLTTHEEKDFNNTIYKGNILGGVVPHAGYIYSGYQAVHFYNALKNNQQHIDTIVIINPNHTGIGKGQFNQSEATAWESPLGKIQYDIDFAEKLNIEAYEPAHANEHSAEVHLPFLQYFLNYTFKIVAITMNVQTFENAQLLASKIFDAAKKTAKNIAVIASGDFSHYETPQTALEKDTKLIQQITHLDSKKIFETVHKYSISACGYGPAATLVEYSKLMYKKPTATLLKYGHSGEINHSEKVVSYASILFTETD